MYTLLGNSTETLLAHGFENSPAERDEGKRVPKVSAHLNPYSDQYEKLLQPVFWFKSQCRKERQPHSSKVEYRGHDSCLLHHLLALICESRQE